MHDQLRSHRLELVEQRRAWSNTRILQRRSSALPSIPRAQRLLGLATWPPLAGLGVSRPTRQTQRDVPAHPELSNARRSLSQPTCCDPHSPRVLAIPARRQSSSECAGDGGPVVNLCPLESQDYFLDANGDGSLGCYSDSSSCALIVQEGEIQEASVIAAIGQQAYWRPGGAASTVTQHPGLPRLPPRCALARVRALLSAVGELRVVMRPLERGPAAGARRTAS